MRGPARTSSATRSHQGAADPRPRRRLDGRPGRGRGDVQPLARRRLRRRREIHLVINNQLGFTTKAIAPARLGSERRSEDGRGADPARERRRPRGGVALRRLAVAIARGSTRTSSSTSSATACTATTRATTRPTPSRCCTRRSSTTPRCAPSTPTRSSSATPPRPQAAEASLDGASVPSPSTLATTCRTPMPHLETPPVPRRARSRRSLLSTGSTGLLDALAAELHSAPAGFTIHPKLERQLTQRLGAATARARSIGRSARLSRSVRSSSRARASG